ncbi:MAG: hypothetical protein KH616_05015 [Burkholderia sp.]|nr:hypothetical protein [Burkholderia sp.]
MGRALIDRHRMRRTMQPAQTLTGKHTQKTKNPALSRVLAGEARIGQLRCTSPNVLGCGGRI